MRTFGASLRLAMAAALICPAFAAQAESVISPNTVDATIGVGESITIHKTITLGDTASTNVDVFFLADNTGSMGATINSAELGASAILDALPTTYQFGVGRYFGDPSEGVAPAIAYTTLQPLTTDTALVQAGIDAWLASGGGDFPEANFFALQQVADTTAWRPEAQRLVVWFGDAPSHTATTTQLQAISALDNANVTVIAFNNAAAEAGIDQGGQASAIVAAVGGSLTNNFGIVSDAGFVAAVLAQIEAASSLIDLVFGSSFAGPGLSLSFACTDALGCTNVGAGQSRTFDLTITGLLPGVYDFSVFAQGVGAVEIDHIVVSGIPEPGTYALALAGLAAVGAVARRRRSSR